MESTAISSSLTPTENAYYATLWGSVAQPGHDVITADIARELMQQSGLPREALFDIWSLSDPMNRGYLTWETFCGAMRLLAYAQQGFLPPMIENAMMPPQVMASFMGTDHPPQMSPPGQPNVEHNPWLISPEDRAEYTKLFTRQDTNHDGLVDAADAKDVFSTSNLPRETLFHIWNLADRSKRGQLDLGEFIVASHLVVSAGLTGEVPSTLPPSLENEFAPQDIQVPPSVPSPVKETVISATTKGTDLDTDQKRLPSPSKVSPVSMTHDTFAYKPTSNIDIATTMNPADLVNAVIEGDRSMASYMQMRNADLSDDLVSLKQLNESLVVDLKEKREELARQLSRHALIQNEVSELRAQHTQLYALRKEVLQQTNSMSGQTELLSAEREFLERGVRELRADIQGATGMTGDLEHATNATNASIKAISGGRHAIVEAIKCFQESYSVEEAKVSELGVAMKRLQQEKHRLQDYNSRQVCQLKEGLSDHAALSVSTGHEARSLVNLTSQLVQTKENEHHMIEHVARAPLDHIVENKTRKATNWTSSTPNFNTTVSRPRPPASVRDAKGVPHSGTVKRNTMDHTPWVEFKERPDMS